MRRSKYATALAPFYLVLVVIISVLAACGDARKTDNSSSAVRSTSTMIPEGNSTIAMQNRIAECGGGISTIGGVTVEAGLKSRVAKSLISSGTFSVGLKEELRAYFLSRQDLTEDVALRLYEEYLACIDSTRSREELVSILVDRRDFAIRRFSREGYDYDEYATSMNEYIGYVARGQFSAAHSKSREVKEFLDEYVFDMYDSQLREMDINIQLEKTDTSWLFSIDDPSTAKDHLKLLAIELEKEKEIDKKKEFDNDYCREVINIYNTHIIDVDYSSLPGCSSLSKDKLWVR